MSQSDLNLKANTGLRFQYIVSAIVVVTLFFIGSLLASIYFKYATEKNTSLIKLHKSISAKANDLRNAIWEADKSLYVLLRDSENVNDDKIKAAFDNVALKLKNIKQVDGVGQVGLLGHINLLAENEEKLNKEVIKLLSLRKDVNWLFPILPLIDTTLSKSNKEFESALNQALAETSITGRSKTISQVHLVLDDIKNTWRLQRLDFRGALIRYAGLNTINKSQEQNIEDYHKLIDKKLNQLESIAKNSELGFETSIAIGVMRASSKQWYKEYHELLRVRNNSSWRSDVEFIERAGSRLASWRSRNPILDQELAQIVRILEEL